MKNTNIDGTINIFNEKVVLSKENTININLIKSAMIKYLINYNKIKSDLLSNGELVLNEHQRKVLIKIL